jgi:2-amino-4-hydroxy-6-hydroxymethyldihydropteridine diphosphokinase
MTRAYVGLGSNVEPEKNIRAAVRLLAAAERVVASSTFYRTESIPPGGPPFINGVLALEASRGPRELKLGLFRAIEAHLGRVRTADKNAPRPIDCDLLVYGDDVVRERDLVLPAPELETRAFVAIPLVEIAPELIVPGSGRKLADVVTMLPRHPMTPLPELTSALRRELEGGSRWIEHASKRSCESC